MKLAIVFVAALALGATRRAPKKTADPPPSAFSVAVSSVTCAWAAKRAELVEHIRKEQRYAEELSGFVDMAKLYRIQQYIRAIDDETQRIITEALKAGAQAVPCASPIVARLSACRNMWRDGDVFSEWKTGGDCDAPDLAPYKAAIRNPL